MSSAPSPWSLLKEHVDLARTLRRLEIHFDPEKCRGVWQCYEVCPVGCWTPNKRRRVVEFHHGERCIACSACVIQCPQGAIELKVPDG
jgi:NAD-dependent dihydropyrimidine dehydrogenase PreA subunit